MQTTHTTIGALMVAAIVASSSVRADSTIDDFRVRVEKWVETRQLISEEKSDWDAERDSLHATRDLLAQEKEALEAEVEELKTATAGADDERRELLLERGEYQRALPRLEERIRAMEQEVLSVAPLLPPPLQSKLEPLLVQIPEDPTKTRLQLGQRLMNVLGVLAQAEKWNGTATLVGETRPVGDQKVQVRTLYWGLGQAVYVDAQGRTAGIGTPGEDGWTFGNDPALAGDAGLLLDIYEGNVDVIDFVGLPVAIR